MGGRPWDALSYPQVVDHEVAYQTRKVGKTYKKNARNNISGGIIIGRVPFGEEVHPQGGFPLRVRILRVGPISMRNP